MNEFNDETNGIGRRVPGGRTRSILRFEWPKDEDGKYVDVFPDATHKFRAECEADGVRFIEAVSHTARPRQFAEELRAGRSIR